MSVDISWDTITSGPDGAALAEKIRDFIHEKFQQIALPRFINSVNVHSFEFGEICPEVEIKEVCDPLPDFYEDEEESDNEDGEHHREHTPSLTSSATFSATAPIHTQFSQTTGHDQYPDLRSAYNSHGILSTAERLAALDVGRGHSSQNTRPTFGSFDSGRFPTVGTPGIPGGTSNMSYFHFPVGGLSGTQTPLAAVASGTLSPNPLLTDHNMPFSYNYTQPSREESEIASSSLRPRTTGSISSPELGSPLYPSSPENRPSYHVAEKVSDDLSLEHIPEIPVPSTYQVQPSDLQVVAHVKYDGDVRMTLTAQILLDYPMPSFVSIPLKLAITGVKFDGVAIVAYIKKRMHLCFLDAEDAKTMIGDVGESPQELDSPRKGTKKAFSSSLLQEIHVESEIGRQERGKQGLKNVSNVEKFVLEQVRRIFEEEFVFPSFWTFLV